ncbi:MAG: hypothetical protein U5L08_07300 [Xanthomonadales bacterium]|nr:hypothetical protein [Xanthomonadales bacterium]
MLWTALEMGNDVEIMRLTAVWRTSNQRGLRHGLPLKRDPRKILIWATDELPILRSQLRPLGICADILEGVLLALRAARTDRRTPQRYE